MSKASSKFSYLTLTLGFIVLALAGFGVLSTYHLNKVEAQTGTAVTGYAWSDNIGWIEFQHNKNNKVTIDADGYFVGFAWSDNIGWLQFNKNLTGPTGNAIAGARIDNGKVVGWARFCAGRLESGKPTTDPNNTCTGTSRTDGWDGWVKFDHGKTGEVTYNSTSKKFAGYAWGSDVVGWIDMKLVGADLGVTPPPALVASCSASPSTLSSAGPVTFTASASGGSGSFTYKWLTNNNSTNVSFTETVTASKTHRVEVSDGSQTKTAECSVSVSVVNPPDPDPETKYNLNVTVVGNGKVTGTGSIDCRADNSGKCSSSINKDAPVSLTAIPDSSQTISWSEATCSGSSCSFSMNSSKTIIVTFADVCTGSSCGGEEPVKFEIVPPNIDTDCVVRLNCEKIPFNSPFIRINNQTLGVLNIEISPDELGNINVSPRYRLPTNTSSVGGSTFSIPQGSYALFFWQFNSRNRTDPSINNYKFNVIGSSEGFESKSIEVNMRYVDLTQTPQ